MENSRKTCGFPVEKRWKRLRINCAKAAEKPRITRGSVAEPLRIKSLNPRIVTLDLVFCFAGTTRSCDAPLDRLLHRA